MERFVTIFYYFFQGILFFQVLFLLVFYAYTKTKESLYFGLFLLFTGINFFISTPRLFFADNDAALDSWWFKLFNIPLVMMGNLFFTLFLRDFFGSLINNKTLSLIIKYALIILSLLFIPFILLYIFNKPTNMVFNIVNFVGMASCVWMTVIIVKKKMRYANLVAIGFGCYIAGSILTSAMLITQMQGVYHHLLIDTYPLFFVKCGILSITVCYMIAIIKKWYYQQKELASEKFESALMAETMKTQLISERNRIAADMHDDMGAGLSRMRYLSTAIQQGTKDETIKKELEKLITGSDELVGKMNEIIWTLNSNDETLEGALAYIRSQCSEMLDNAGIHINYNLPESFPPVVISSEKKRNLYLVVKEAVHNIIKHSGATNAIIECSIDGELHISIADNGKGFNPDTAKKNGNGLLNYKKRIDNLKGTYQLITAPEEGTKLVFSIPLYAIN